jgi:aspartate 4-decarboxylase
MAEDHGIVLLNGGGFETPDWSLRVSLANLPDEAYEDIAAPMAAPVRAQQSPVT